MQQPVHTDMMYVTKLAEMSETTSWLQLPFVLM